MRGRMQKTLLRCWCSWALLSAAPLAAQLAEDPSSLPFPLPDFDDPERAVVIAVTFETPASVSLDNVLISNTRARTSIGDPQQVLLESLDSSGEVLAQRYSWHPLRIRQWDIENVNESADFATSGPGTFYVPLQDNLAAVRISDVESGLILMTVDVSAEVDAFCDFELESPFCKMFADGFED